MASTQVDRYGVPTPVRVFSTAGTNCKVETSDDFVEVNVASQAVTVSLPSWGGPYTIIDGSNEALAYPITIEDSTGDTVGIINVSGGSMSFGWDGTAMVRLDRQADASPLTIATGISAAGTTQAGATLLAASRNVVTTVAAGSGVILSADFAEVVVSNRGANALSVYPPAGMTIESLGTNAAAGVAVGQSTTFFYAGGTQWYVR